MNKQLKEAYEKNLSTAKAAKTWGPVLLLISILCMILGPCLYSNQETETVPKGKESIPYRIFEEDSQVGDFAVIEDAVLIDCYCTVSEEQYMNNVPMGTSYRDIYLGFDETGNEIYVLGEEYSQGEDPYPEFDLLETMDIYGVVTDVEDALVDSGLSAGDEFYEVFHGRVLLEAQEQIFLPVYETVTTTHTNPGLTYTLVGIGIVALGFSIVLSRVRKRNAAQAEETMAVIKRESPLLADVLLAKQISKDNNRYAFFVTKGQVGELQQFIYRVPQGNFYAAARWIIKKDFSGKSLKAAYLPAGAKEEKNILSRLMMCDYDPAKLPELSGAQGLSFAGFSTTLQHPVNIVFLLPVRHVAIQIPKIPVSCSINEYMTVLATRDLEPQWEKITPSVNAAETGSRDKDSKVEPAPVAKLGDTVRAESVAEAAVLLQATVKEGICGENIRWELCADGTLMLTGTGPVPDYEQGKSPFGMQEVQTLIITEGITDVGDHAFFGLENLTSVNLPSTLSRIGQSAFAFCKALPRVEIPESVTEIGPCAFDNCLSLRRALIHPVIPKIGMWAFAGCPKLTLFVHETGTALLYAMQNNLKVANIDLPEPPEEEDCTGFEEVLIGENDDVVYDEDAKTLAFVIGNAKSVVPVGQVEKIQMCTSDGGPFVDDMWTEIYVPGHMYKLMSGNPKSQPIIFEALSHAFPMDLEKIVEASTCTMNRTFLLYEREKVSDAKDVHHDEQEEVSVAKDVHQCAQDRDAEEQMQLGRRLYSGDGVPRDLKAAAECFRRAAELGNADGQHNLGYCYEQGIGLSKDLASAAFWYQKAAEQGTVESQFNLGVAYNTGRGVAMDKAMAAKWMEKAAEQGFALAQFNIGTYYENGNGVDVDWNKAFYWYQKASEQGLAMAQTNLALCYLKGNGTEENLEKAVEWMEKAAAGGDENAQGQLPMLKILLNIKEKRKDSEGNV